MVHHQCHALQSHPPITNVDTIQREVSYLALGVSVTPTWSPRYSIHMGPSHLLLVCLLCKSSQPCVLVHFPSIAITPFYPCHPTIPLFSFLPSVFLTVKACHPRRLRRIAFPHASRRRDLTFDATSFPAYPFHFFRTLYCTDFGMDFSLVFGFCTVLLPVLPHALPFPLVFSRHHPPFIVTRVLCSPVLPRIRFSFLLSSDGISSFTPGLHVFKLPLGLPVCYRSFSLSFCVPSP